MSFISVIDEHDWNSYLIETHSVAAPAGNFRQSFIPPENLFQIGEKLESIDPRNQDSWCIGTIISKDGPRVRIRLDGTDDRNDFWRLVDSSDIRAYGTTAKLGGQIVLPLGFQQNSSRWAKYFERYIKNGPFADESCFKPSPEEPEKNLFEIGEKLEAVDPRHSHLICPATVTKVSPGDHGIVISLDGWSSSNSLKVKSSSRDIFPVGWCKAAGIRIAKTRGYPFSRASNKQNGNHPTQLKKKKTILSSTLVEEIPSIQKKEDLIVTVYWNYVGDNGGVLLNPQRFHYSMPLVFGPDECHSVLKTIFDSCVNCSFQPTLFINRIRDIFTVSNEVKKHSSTEIKLENGTSIDAPLIETEEDFWDVIQVFQNGILAGNDLFISTPPLQPFIEQNNNNKRKSIEFDLDDETYHTNGKVVKSTSGEELLSDTKSSLNGTRRDLSNVISDRLDQYTPNDVAMFIREIDSSFDDLASRFLQEEVDGKALLLLSIDTLMRHMGLKLGPSLKIIHQIEKLRK